MTSGARNRSISKALGACRSFRSAVSSPRQNGRFVIDARYVRARPSGIGSYTAALIERLPALAPEAHFRLWTHPERPEPVSAPNVSSLTVPATADGLRTLLRPSSLDALEPTDTVHFPFSLLGRGLPCASVVTIHDLMWLEHAAKVDARPLLRRARANYYQVGMRNALRHATRLIAVSLATADRIRAVRPEAADRVRVIHNAAGPAFTPVADLDAAAERAAEVVGSRAPYYVVVGKNEPYKAHQLVLEAFARESNPEELLVLVQRTRRGKGLAKLAETLGITSKIRWLPTLSEPELVSVLQGARALLQPSLVEGFGIPVLEAMAAGCPVIASDTPALVEVLGGAGLHAPVGDAAGLATAMRKVRDAALRAELRARGLERAQAFSWDRAAAATLEVYREAAAEGPARGSHA
jgi:glycosyltransferase involved in cell wall biosynthesis